MNLLRKRIESFEKILGCHVCVHEYPGEMSKFAGCPRTHSNRFCEKVKIRKGNEILCLESDYRHIKNRMASTRHAFLKICHAGYLEAVSPIFIDDTLVAAVFAGPYSVNIRNLRNNGDLFIDPLSSAAKTVVSDLDMSPPRADEVFLPHLLNMIEILGNSMENFLQKSMKIENPGWQEPKTRILFFFEHDFGRDVYLKDLAKSLGIGESRAGQLLRIHFKMNFPQMLNERRIEHAKRLLLDTNMKISTIAEECGYTDPSYFYRLFRRISGNTPDEFRRKLTDPVQTNFKI